MTNTARDKEYAHGRTILEKMRRHTKPYRILIYGRNIPVLPGVFSPKYISDVKWFAREVPKLVGKRSFLEIGTGTGVIALFVGLNGARFIVATDIHHAAVQNAKETFRLHTLRVSVRLGDVFTPIRKSEKFDVIFWNHPFHFSETKARTMLERGGYDYRYESLEKFFAGAKHHLVPGGEVLLGTSKNARLDLIKAKARTYGYTCHLVKKEMIQSEHRRGVTMDVRLYSFKSR